MACSVCACSSITPAALRQAPSHCPTDFPTFVAHHQVDHWTASLGGEFEHFVPADGAARFEYAVVYRHGIVNGAKSYEFWDNNGGGNYRVEKQVAPQ